MSTDEFNKRRTEPGVPNDVLAFGAPSDIPKMIGPYRIECLLEKGGMSTLYLGVHPDSGEVTTIKVLLPKFLSHPEVVQRFLKEAEIIAMSDHPNIVKLYGHGEWEGGLYIAMEFIPGTSLRQALLQQPISLKRALEIVIDIAYALCHLHTHGVIHRDLKPENVLITESGDIKVIDFGIAQLLTEKELTNRSAGKRVIGTPIYMSPEQRENPSAVSYPSDIYSLGIIAYELALGRLSHGIIHLALMPKGLQRILGKALQPNPQDRYHDVVDFITDVSSYLNSTNLEKEKTPGDQLSEISQDLRNIQDILVPSLPPNWKGMELYCGNVKGMNLFGIYYDFFAFPEGTYGIVLTESSAKGAEGLICAAMLRGMVQSLINQHIEPIQLCETLNRLICKDRKDGIFTFGYLLLDPLNKNFKYISCGKTNLWKMSSSHLTLESGLTNPPLGEDKEVRFVQKESSFEPGDSLIFSSFIEDNLEEKASVFMEKIFQENGEMLVAKKIVDAVLRQAKLSLPKLLQDRSLSIIGLTLGVY